jgi:hypothetical protein
VDARIGTNPNCLGVSNLSKVVSGGGKFFNKKLEEYRRINGLRVKSFDSTAIRKGIPL